MKCMLQISRALSTLFGSFNQRRKVVDWYNPFSNTFWCAVKYKAPCEEMPLKIPRNVEAWGWGGGDVGRIYDQSYLSEVDVKTHPPCQIPLDPRAPGISRDVQRKKNQPCQQSNECILNFLCWITHFENCSLKLCRLLKKQSTKMATPFTCFREHMDQQWPELRWGNRTVFGFLSLSGEFYQGVRCVDSTVDHFQTEKHRLLSKHYFFISNILGH
jgi:hypothetical protein